MKPAFIPDVPTKITRQQLIDAVKALGMEPYTIRSLHIGAEGATVEINLYVTPEPDLGDEHAFLRSTRPSDGQTMAVHIPVRDDRYPGGVMPV